MDKFKSIEQKVIYEKLIKGVDRFSEQEISNSVIEEVGKKESNQYNINKISRYIAEIGQYIEILQKTRENKAFRYISSHRKYLGNGIVFGKKIVRKCLKWYIEPICFQQTDFNNAVTPSIGRLTEIQSELMNAIIILDTKQHKLEKQYAETQQQLIEKNKMLNKYNIEIQDKLTKLQKEYNVLQDKLGELENKNNLIENNLDDRLNMLENMQSIANEQIINNNNKILKLEELDLEIFKNREVSFWNKKTMAQSGEDSIVAYITMVLGLKFEECTYLDLGANHAKDLSNTYLFYSKGARGVLVEANPKLIPELKFYRNEDIIVNKCISTSSGDKVEFYILNGDGLSTPDINSANNAIKENPNLEIIDTVQVDTITVNDIIDKYLGKAPVIMNIDIEGKDVEILESIDFDKYRPLIIIAEMINYKTSLVIGEKNTEIIDLMRSKNYIEYAFTGINSIFIDKEQIRGEL